MALVNWDYPIRSPGGQVLHVAFFGLPGTGVCVGGITENAIVPYEGIAHKIVFMRQTEIKFDKLDLEAEKAAYLIEAERWVIRAGLFSVGADNGKA